MKKRQSIFILIVLLLTTCLFTSDLPPVYSTIKDLKKPTIEDYKKIQDYLKNGSRENLELLTQSVNPNEKYFRYDKRARNFNLISKDPNIKISSDLYIYNTDKNDKTTCIICYCSFNDNYPQGIKRIDKALKKIGYKGHFIAKIGGWPNLQENDLTLAHIPYAFKPCFFGEAKSLGYKNVLWIDTSIIPLKDLSSIFEKIEKQGYFGYIVCHKVVDYANDYVLKTFNLDKKQAENILTIEAGIIGLNLHSEIGQKILSDWKKAALNGGFYSARPDQNAFSIIAYKNNLKNWDSPTNRPCRREDINNQSIFCIDQTFQPYP